MGPFQSNSLKISKKWLFSWLMTGSFRYLISGCTQVHRFQQPGVRWPPVLHTVLSPRPCRPALSPGRCSGTHSRPTSSWPPPSPSSRSSSSSSWLTWTWWTFTSRRGDETCWEAVPGMFHETISIESTGNTRWFIYINFVLFLQQPHFHSNFVVKLYYRAVHCK